MLRLLSVLCVSAVLFAADTKPKPPDEDESLQEALSEAGSSNVDFLRALEKHLKKFPKTERRPEIERALLKAAIEAADRPRIVSYGESVLARETIDLKTLESVIRAQLAVGGPDHAAKALDYAKRYEKGVLDFEKSESSRTADAKFREDIERGYGRAYVLEASALGGLNRLPEALETARKSYATFPTAESAREIGKLLAASGKDEEAVRYYAEAFAIPDPRNKDADRAADRLRMGELYRKLKGSEAGLGALLLEAYDRTAQVQRERALELKQLDPNASLTNPMEFTLTGVEGGKLALPSLKGKVVVMDFWATWCGPCRIQHGLYEQVKAHFKDRSDVRFLSINTDEDKDLVPEFLTAQRWDKQVWYDDGLATALRINSIPTSLLINKRGEIESRMNGFLPDRFVDQLTERIRGALNQ